MAQPRTTPAPELLRAWLAEHAMTQADLARRVGCSDVHLWHLLDGRKRPSLALAVAISRETGGRVPAEAWIPHAA